jgi:uncharacterized membrane protein YdjX (TVP38/TMEM64 family)
MRSVYRGPVTRFVTALTVGCLVGAFVAQQTLSDLASDGLSFAEWVEGLLAGVVVGAGGALIGFYGTRWVDRHWFGDEDDE